MGGRQGDCDGKDMLVEALGRNDSQHVLTTQGSLGKFTSINQGRKESSLPPEYYSGENSVRGPINIG